MSILTNFPKFFLLLLSSFFYLQLIFFNFLPNEKMEKYLKTLEKSFFFTLLYNLYFEKIKLMFLFSPIQYYFAVFVVIYAAGFFLAQGGADLPIL